MFASQVNKRENWGFRKEIVISPKVILRSHSNQSSHLVSLALRVKWKLDPMWMGKMSCGTARVDDCYCFLPRPGLWHFVPEEILDLWWFSLAKLETSEMSHSCFHSLCFYTEDCIDKQMNEASFSHRLVMTIFSVCPCHGSHDNISYADAVQVTVCVWREFFVWIWTKQPLVLTDMLVAPI